MAILSPQLKQKFFNSSGAPLSGGKLFSYQAGTTTPLVTYTDSTESSANTNPIILDANGECDVWLGANSYKFVLKDSADVTQWTVDNVNQSGENQNISSDVFENFGLTASASLNALTISITNGIGGTPSLTNPVRVGFRSPTISSGLSNVVSINSALGMTISAGSTLGHSSGVQDFIFVYLIYNNGAAEVAVSGTLYPEFALYSTVAEGGAGGADTRGTIYSVTARTNVPMRLVGRMTVTQATAGDWVTLPSQIQAGALDQIYTDSKVLTTRPTVSRVTRANASGGFSAAASGTYTTPANVRYLRIKMSGGGGGGAGAGTSGGPGGPGANGGSTTFGSSFLTCTGGDGAAAGGNKGGNGGTVTINSPGIAIVAISGGGGATTQQQGTAGTSIFNGAQGGVNAFGGSNGATWASSGQNGSDDTGAGGSGGSMTTNGTANSFGGSGGGAGGYMEVYVQSPNATYSYTVGAGGNGGTAGTNGGAGGGGAGGVIIIEEFYV